MFTTALKAKGSTMNYTAVQPIPGFEDVKNYILEPIDDIFYRLKNADGDAPSFTLIHPAVLRNDYVFDLPENLASLLELEKEEDALVLVMMILDTPLENSHVNFIAPLVFNTRNGKMLQVILDASRYPDYGVAEPLKRYLQKSEAS